jgi:hypothetical protein
VTSSSGHTLSDSSNTSRDVFIVEDAGTDLALPFRMSEPEILDDAFFEEPTVVPQPTQDIEIPLVSTSVSESADHTVVRRRRPDGSEPEEEIHPFAVEVLMLFVRRNGSLTGDPFLMTEAEWRLDTVDRHELSWLSTSLATVAARLDEHRESAARAMLIRLAGLAFARSFRER